MTDDRLIDIVAGDLTAAAPTGALRGRVLARIAQPARSTALSWLVPAAAVTTVAVVAVVVMVARRDPPVSVSPASSILTQSSASPSTTTAAGDAPSRPSMTAPSRPARRIERRPATPSTTEIDGQWMERIVPPLDRPAPIVLDNIQPIGLAIAPISMDPLVTEPLVLPPMTGGTSASSGQ